MDLETAHKVLGVHQYANREQIERSFREKARSVHPDRGGTLKDWQDLVQARDLAIDRTFEPPPIVNATVVDPIIPKYQRPWQPHGSGPRSDVEQDAIIAPIRTEEELEGDDYKLDLVKKVPSDKFRKYAFTILKISSVLLIWMVMRIAVGALFENVPPSDLEDFEFREDFEMNPNRLDPPRRFDDSDLDLEFLD